MITQEILKDKHYMLRHHDAYQMRYQRPIYAG